MEVQMINEIKKAINTVSLRLSTYGIKKKFSRLVSSSWAIVVPFDLLSWQGFLLSHH